MKAFNVYLPTNNVFRHMLIDTVYFTNDCDAEWVKMSLITHDNYSTHIVVEEVV